MQAIASLNHTIHKGGVERGWGGGGFPAWYWLLNVSFCLKELILFSKENSSKLYVCFFDCKQAFDRVWVNGLIYKLIYNGLDLKKLNCLRNLYTGLFNKVPFRNSTSNDSFPVSQGTRQREITSLLLYLVYIDDLIRQLETSGYGTCIAGADCSSLSVAYDIILVYFPKYGLQKMMDICFNYYVKWRYMYNPFRCAVIVFNELQHFIASRSWRLGVSVVREVVDYTHLGIICNKFMNSSVSIDDSCHKLKSTNLGL